MTYDSWRDAIADIRKLTGTVTADQQKLALAAGLELPDTLPDLVAAARLQNALGATLRLDRHRPVSEYARTVIGELRSIHDVNCSPEDGREADAWVTFLQLRRRGQELERLELHAGDVVEILDSGDLAEVSSISGTGRVNFKGGLGSGDWPDRFVVACRRDEEGEGAEQVRRRADNQRAARVRRDRWSAAKQAELQEFEVNEDLTPDDVKQLADTIGFAKDEKPIQKLAESRPQLLTALIGGQQKFCIPHARLGAEYVTDFLVASVDSLGIWWMLVELETPQSDVTMRRSNDLDKHARKGVSQIEEWREWLLQNSGYAVRPRREGGLGLLDIRPLSSGLVIVGRESRLNDNSATVRNRYREQNRLEIHTYDWWIGQLWGILKYGGPWGTNPYIRHREDELASW